MLAIVGRSTLSEQESKLEKTGSPLQSLDCRFPQTFKPLNRAPDSVPLTEMIVRVFQGILDRGV